MLYSLPGLFTRRENGLPGPLEDFRALGKLHRAGNKLLSGLRGQRSRIAIVTIGVGDLIATRGIGVSRRDIADIAVGEPTTKTRRSAPSRLICIPSSTKSSPGTPTIAQSRTRSR